MPYLSDSHKKLMARDDAYGRRRQPITAGELTYCHQRTLKEFLDVRPEYRYEDLAMCLGALEGCRTDFINRILLPYEQAKKEENGDCW